MKRTTPLFSFALIAITASSAHAQNKSPIEKRYSQTYNQCMSSGDAANGVTSGILDCNGAETTVQDAKLNQAYKMVMARLTPDRKVALRTSERNWIKSRDQACTKRMGDEAGGTLGQVIYSGCILDETIKRTIYLEQYK